MSECTKLVLLAITYIHWAVHADCLFALQLALLHGRTTLTRVRLFAICFLPSGHQPTPAVVGAELVSVLLVCCLSSELQSLRHCNAMQISLTSSATQSVWKAGEASCLSA